MLTKMRQWLTERHYKKIIRAFADNRREEWKTYTVEELHNAMNYLYESRHMINTIDELIHMSMAAHLLHRGASVASVVENLPTYQTGVLLRWWCQCERENKQYEEVYQYLSERLTNTTIPLLGPLWHGATLDVDDWDKIFDYWPHYYSYLYPDDTLVNQCLVDPKQGRWLSSYLFNASTPMQQMESYALAATHFLFKNYPDNWRSRIDADDFFVEVYEELSHMMKISHPTPILNAVIDFWCNPASSWRYLADVMPSIDIFTEPSVDYNEAPLY